MQIIAGIASGIRLDVPRGLAVRPTSVRAKKALFDSVGGWEGRCVVDLFAGCGGMGLEAASRGAAEVALVEMDRIHCEMIRGNTAKVAKAGVSAPVKVVCANALQAHRRLPELAGRIDIIFADPPYSRTMDCMRKMLSDNEFAKWAGQALLIWKMPDAHDGDCIVDGNDLKYWAISARRRYEGTDFFFLARRTAELTGREGENP